MSDVAETRERHPRLLGRSNALLVVVDVQARLLPVIEGAAELESRLSILIAGAKTLGIPILFTEQYPKGLGPTLPGLRELVPEAPVLSKLSFSCGGDPGFRSAVRGFEKAEIVVAGIEAHVCVLQTALDLVALGYQVHVPFDATSSRRRSHAENGLRRMGEEGVVVTNVESVLFEAMNRCDIAEFRAISGLLK